MSNWQERAECAKPEHDPEQWFAADQMRNPVRKEHYDQARAICAVCPVQLACLEYALNVRPTDGVWAGVVFRMTNSRQNLLRDRDRFVRAVARGKYRRLAGERAESTKVRDTYRAKERRRKELEAMLDTPEWRAIEASLDV